MQKKLIRRYLGLAAGVLGAWIFLRWGLPIGLPFLLGTAMALAAEPIVAPLNRRLHMPRWLATAIGVTSVFVLLIAVLMLLIALLVREAGQLARIMPDLTETARRGLGSLEGWMLEVAGKAPEGIRPALTDSVTDLFSGGSSVMDLVGSKLLGMATGFLGWLTGSAFGLGTGVLAAFMISAKLPKIREYWGSNMPPVWRERYIPALKGLKSALTGWLTAQLKLTGVTLGLLLMGFWVLRIPYAPVWALLVAVVDAFPVLGTGTVLLPWSFICLLQGDQARGIGLLGVYAVVWLTRSVLEPKLLGRELGLDPLVTLIAMYTGYQLFGLLGMILAPILAVAVVRSVKALSPAPNGEENTA